MYFYVAHEHHNQVLGPQSVLYNVSIYYIVFAFLFGSQWQNRSHHKPSLKMHEHTLSEHRSGKVIGEGAKYENESASG